MATRDSDSHSDDKTTDQDKPEFVAIIHTFYDSIYAFCANQVSDPRDAEDLTQEVFVAAYANAHQLRDVEQLGQWLMSIAYNLSRRFYRQKYKEKEELSIEEMAPNILETGAGLIAVAAEEEALDQPEFSPLYELMESIPELARESLTLHCMEDVSYEDIAKLLNVPLSTIKGRIYNARQWLLTNGLSPSTPREIRQQIAKAATDVVRNYSELRETLSTDLLENQLILALLHPIRITQNKVKTYTFGPGKPKNIMILMDIHSSDHTRTTALIKSNNKIAISAFLQLLPEDKHIYVMFTNPETWAITQDDCDVEASRSYATYGLLSKNHNLNSNISDAVEVTSDKESILKSLSQNDDTLKRILACMRLEQRDYLTSLRLFTYYSELIQNPDAYAVFIYSDIGNLWELATISTCTDNNFNYIQQCIDLGSSVLISDGYYITVNSVEVQDTIMKDLIQPLGFVPLFTQARALIAIK